MRRRSWAMGRAALVLASLAVSAPALADGPTPLQKADALFNAGRALLDAGEYSEACPKFAEANTLAPGLGVTLYLADCYERLGKTASALAEFRHAVSLAKARGDKRAAVATARAEALVHRVPKLVVNVSPEAVEQSVQIVEDGKPFPKAAWGVSAGVDPGDHVFDVTAEGRVARSVVVHLAPDDKTHTETIGPLDAPVAPSPVASSSPAEARKPDRRFLWIAAGSAAVGVVGLALGTAFGVSAKSKLSDSNDGPCDATNHCTSAGLALRSDAEHAGNASTVAFVIGGVGIATGAVVYLVRPRPTSPSASITLSPTVSTSGPGFHLAGAF